MYISDSNLCRSKVTARYFGHELNHNCLLMGVRKGYFVFNANLNMNLTSFKIFVGGQNFKLLIFRNFKVFQNQIIMEEWWKWGILITMLVNNQSKLHCETTNDIASWSHIWNLSGSWVVAQLKREDFGVKILMMPSSVLLQ